MDWTVLIGPAIGAVGLGIAAWFALRGTRTTANTAGLDNAAKWWKEAVGKLEDRIEDLERDRTEIKSAFRELKRDNAELAEENRLFRAVLTGVLSRVQQMPTFSPNDIIDYIREHLPMLGKEKE